MAFLSSKKRFEQYSENDVTDEVIYLKRRRFLQALGLGSLGATGLAAGFQQLLYPRPGQAGPAFSSFKHNPHYQVPERALSDESTVLSYNNFYEFSTHKRMVAGLARDFKIDPYQLQIDGLVDKPMTFGLEELERFALEERIYRFRCVEAWAMTVPWLGFPLHHLLSKVGIKSNARYIRMISFLDPQQAPGQNDPQYHWPYYEALRIDEAMHDLCFVALGLYGKRLAPQNGTPLRIVVPWKYGYKGPKSVVKIIVTDKKPGTFWNDLYPSEYSFTSNVDPLTPHPRWSQATERLLGSGERVDTLPYNGYGEHVAGLYQ